MIQQHPKARQVPVEGGSSSYPSGAIQFRNDWPGLFIRGDDALALLFELQATLRDMQRISPKAGLGWRTSELMRIIESDVLLREGTDV